jgi:aspartyl-tRNA(Asn)/glutamyl-tRNA(Gln) amidotransferase subunit A
MARIRPGESITAAQYNKLVELRKRFIQSINAAAGPYDAMLMPTVPETAPTIAEVTKDDESYFRFNSRMLRNPSLVNLFDGCALTIPCHEPGSAPVGLTIAGIQNADRSILVTGGAIESIVRRDKVVG